MDLVQLLRSKLRRDERCQARAEMNEDHAQNIAEYLDAGGSVPPVVAFRDSRRCCWLADGWHRDRACDLTRPVRKYVETDLRSGELEDAILFAVGVNARHTALTLTNEDKRRAVLIVLTHSAEWADPVLWPNTRVAAACGVSEGLVRSLRGRLAEAAAKEEASHDTKLPPAPSAVVETLSTYRRPRAAPPFRDMAATEQRVAVEAETHSYEGSWRREVREGLKQAERGMLCLHWMELLPRLRGLIADLPHES